MAPLQFADTVPIISDMIAFFGNERTNNKNLQAVRETNQTNMAIAQANNEAAAALQEKNNQFNAEQSELSYNRNRDLSLELLRNNQLYNSAQAQAYRYGMAGINPNVAFSNGTSAVVNGSGASASSPASSAALPQFQAPSLIPGQVQNPFQQINIASDLANFMKSIAEAKKAGVDSKVSLEKLDGELLQMFSNAHLSEAKAQHEEILAGIDKALLPTKLATEIKHDIADIELKAAQGKLADADAALKRIQEQFTNTQNENLKQQAPFIIKQLEEQIKLLQEQQKTETSKQTANFATADEARSRITVNEETAKQVHELAVQLHTENFALTQNKVQKAMALTRQLEREGVQTDLLKELLDKARKDNSSYYYKLAVDLASQLIGDVTGLKGAFSK